MARLDVVGLPEGALAAAAAFHAEWLARARAQLGELAQPVPLPLAGGARGGPVATAHIPAPTDPPPTPPASGRGVHLLLVFPPADHTHRGWRLAAIQGLAREHAPLRVNGVASADPAAIAAAEVYLAGAEGLTGQYLSLDGAGAGPVLGLEQ